MASAMLTSDLDSMFADPFFTVPVVFGVLNTRGIFDWADTVAKDGVGLDVLTKQRIVTIRTGTLAGVANQSNVTVDGIAYVVADVNHAEDALISHIALKAVT